MKTWLILPFIAAAIGWFTNFLAVRMLFRPHRRINVLGLKIQGLLPKRQKEFAESIGQTIETHLLTREEMKRLVNNKETHARFQELIQARLDDFFENKLAMHVPMLAAFLKGPIVDKIKKSLADEVETMITEGAEVIGNSLDKSLNLKQIVVDKIVAFDLRKLEQIILDIASTELRWIEILGAILGFLVGIIQLGLLQLLA